MNKKIALSFLSSTFFVASIMAAAEEFTINSPINEWGWTQLHKLVRQAHNHDHFKTLEKFITDGAIVDERDNEGLTPLHHAAFMGHPESISILLSHGANINAEDRAGWTPLHVAAFNGNFACLCLLISSGANVRAKIGEIVGEIEGCTPLHCAASGGSLPCLIELLNVGANPDRIARDEKGETPLHKAAKMGHLPCVKKLLDHDGFMYKSCITFQNLEEKTPEMVAHEHGHQEIADYLKLAATQLSKPMSLPNTTPQPKRRKRRILS